MPRPVLRSFSGISVLFAALTIALCAPAQETESPPKPAPLTIISTELPHAVLHASYYAQLRASGGTPPLQWNIVSGTLPNGLELDDETGQITGQPTQPGDFTIVIEVSDSAQPPQTAQHEFKFAGAPALAVRWRTPATVNGRAIEGSVEVANATGDDFDMTVIIVAVNEYGKAFALGYQHFTLNRETTGLQIDFGSTVPAGSYVVHVDAVAEVPKRDAIFRARLQTPNSLAVTVGP